MGFKKNRVSKKKNSHHRHRIQSDEPEDKSQKPSKSTEADDESISPTPPPVPPPPPSYDELTGCSSHPNQPCRLTSSGNTCTKKPDIKLSQTTQPKCNPNKFVSENLPTQRITKKMIEEALKAARVAVLEGLVNERNVYLDYKDECVKQKVSLDIRAQDFNFIRVSTIGTDAFVEFVDEIDKIPGHEFVPFHSVAIEKENLYDIMSTNVYRNIPALPQLYEKWCTNYLKINIIKMKNDSFFNEQFKEIAKEQQELLKMADEAGGASSFGASTAEPTTIACSSTDKGAIPKIIGYNKKKPSKISDDGSGPNRPSTIRGNKNKDKVKDEEDMDAMVDSLTFDIKRKLVVRDLQIRNHAYKLENFDIISEVSLISEEIERHYRGLERLGVTRLRINAVIEQFQELILNSLEKPEKEKKRNKFCETKYNL